MICGVGRIGGLYAGIRHQPLRAWSSDPDRPGSAAPRGILYRGGIAKISAFSRACNDDGIPLLWLQDISGFDIGAEAERQGLLGYGSSLIYTNSHQHGADVHGAAAQGLGRRLLRDGRHAVRSGGAALDGLSRLSVMEGRTLAIATYNTKLDDDFQIVVTDPESARRSRPA
jgi:acetyl-CoA carboxylase carboxyltransferase component